MKGIERAWHAGAHAHMATASLAPAGGNEELRALAAVAAAHDDARVSASSRVVSALLGCVVVAAGCGRLDYDTEPRDAGLDAPGLDAPGLDAPGLDASGLDAPGLDASGLDASGLDASGLDASGLDASGLDAAELDAAELDAARSVDASRGVDALVPLIDAPFELPDVPIVFPDAPVTLPDVAF